MQLYFGGNYGIYATIGQYVPVFATSTKTGTNYKTLARVVYEKDFSGFNIAFGGYYIGGDVSNLATKNPGNSTGIDVDSLDRESTGLDLQVEGNVAGMSLMVTGGYVISNTYSKKTKDMNGFSLAAQLNPIKTIGVKLAILGYSDNKNSNNDELIYSTGVEYSYRQNVRFGLEYSHSTFEDGTKSDNNDILFMSMIAF